MGDLHLALNEFLQPTGWSLYMNGLDPRQQPECAQRTSCSKICEIRVGGGRNTGVIPDEEANDNINIDRMED